MSPSLQNDIHREQLLRPGRKGDAIRASSTPLGECLMALTLSGFWRQVGCMDRRQIGGLRPVSPNDFLQCLFKVTMPLRHIYINHIICC